MERRDPVRSAGGLRRSGASRPCRRRRRRRSPASRSGPWTARPSIAARRRSPSPRTAGSSPGRPATPRRARARSTFARSTASTRPGWPGPKGRASPFFSPDGRWIGFFADGKLKKIAAAGGSPSIVADAPGARRRRLGPGRPDRLRRTPGRRTLARLRSRRGGHRPDHAAGRCAAKCAHLSPSWLTGGTAILFTSATSPVAGAPGDLAVVPLGSRSHRDPARRGHARRVAGPGYLLMSSGSDLQAATFDERTLTLTGAADSVLAAVTGGDRRRPGRRQPGGHARGDPASAAGTRRLDRSARAPTRARSDG